MLVSLLLSMVVAGAPGSSLAELMASWKSGRTQEPVRLEVYGLYRGSFQSFEVYSSGVGIAGGQKQFVYEARKLAKALEVLEKHGFASMPEQFGGKPRPTNKPELYSAVALRIGNVEKTVVQMRDGERSPQFATIVEKLFELFRKELASGKSVGGFAEGLQQILQGQLAVETLRLEFSREEKPGQFSTFTVAGGFFTFAPGNGTVVRGWLSRDKLLELAKALAGLGAQGGQVRFSWSRAVSLEASVLGKSFAAQGRAWASPTAEQAASFAKSWESFEETLRAFIKENLPRAS